MSQTLFEKFAFVLISKIAHSFTSRKNGICGVLDQLHVAS